MLGHLISALSDFDHATMLITLFIHFDITFLTEMRIWGVIVMIQSMKLIVYHDRFLSAYAYAKLHRTALSRNGSTLSIFQDPI